jgi:hypothetical protein
MKKFVFAAICSVTLTGYALADEFLAVITKVDGNNITYYKAKAAAGKGGKGGKGGGGFGGKAEKDGDAVKGTAAAKVAVLKGAFDPDTKEFKAGDAIEGGLTNDMFKNASDDMPVTVTLTIADDGADKGKITKMVTKGGGKGGKKKGG